MELNNFYDNLITSIRVAADANNNFVRSEFIEECSFMLSEAEEISDFQLCHFEGVGFKKRKLQIDGYSFDDADDSLAIIIGEFQNENDIPSIGVLEARKAFSAAKAFFEEAVLGNLTNGSIDEAQPGFSLAFEIKNRYRRLSSVRVYLVSNCQLNTRVQDWPNELFQDVEIQFHIWDINRFHRAHVSISGRDELEVDFEKYFIDGLESLKAGSTGASYEAYQCVIPGLVLAQIYTKYGSRLLEGNVRSYLSTKVKINSGIQETIKNNPEMFFAYNNGISATAESVVFEPGSRLIKKIVNLQIVNGGQTTASLALAHRNSIDLSKINVQMKLSVLPPEKSGEMIPLIARYANSQNKVSDSDFFANHPYHIRLQELSRVIETPPAMGKQYGTKWFYERARGQFNNEHANLTKSQKEQFLLKTPKSQLLTKTDVAKFVNTWRGLPHIVSMGAQKNFSNFAEFIAKEWNEGKEQFNEHYFKNLVSLAIIFKSCESLVTKLSWYQGGYRANIVTYTLAKLHLMITTQAPGHKLDINSIWTNQEIPGQLQDHIALIAKEIFLTLISKRRLKDNVTEWAKTSACWEQVRKLEIQLNLDLVVPEKFYTQSQDKAAYNLSDVSYSVFASTEVMSISGEKWSEMLSWANEKSLLSPREDATLRKAIRIPKFAPSGKDCERILKIRKKIIEKGFKFTHN